ncbi:MAG TPA: hypothetical protein VKE98_03340 [Gemmataceae bacterium]|nr:hypothetical protein [Gemmataceae bacterium]
MKLSDKLQILKHKKTPDGTGPQPQCARNPIATSTWVLVGLILILGGVGTLFVFEFFVWTRVPPALVGVWEINEGPPKGTTFDFDRNGDMELIPNFGNGKSRKARVIVRDKTLVMSEPDRTGKELKIEYTIRELTADTLILELENGDVLKMVRQRLRSAD